MLVVYLANRYIRIIDGTLNGENPNVRFSHSIFDADGCVVNGVIKDAQGLEALLDAAWKEHKLPKTDVRLIVESSQFNSKQMEVPMQKPRILLDYIGREFADVERIEDPVYGYCSLQNRTVKKKKSDKNKKEENVKQPESINETGANATEAGEQEHKVEKNKTIDIYATLAPREYLKEYYDIFQKIGVTISSMECARSSILHMLTRLQMFSDATCILQFVDDMYLINILEYEGKMAYINRTRLFSEADSPGYLVEIARTVSNILQFAKAQHMDGQIPTVFAAGLKSEHIELYKQRIAEVNAEMEVCEWSQHVSHEYVIAASGLFSEVDKTRLIFQMHRNPEEEKKRVKRLKTLLPVASLASVLVIAAIVLGVQVLDKTRRLEQMNQYMQDSATIERLEKYDNAYALLMEYNAKISTLTALKERIERYPMANSRMEEILKECAKNLAEVEIVSYSAENGVLTFDTSAPDAEQIYLFVNLLAAQDIFAEVNYTGYTQNSDTSWTVQVNCVLAPRMEETDES